MNKRTKIAFIMKTALFVAVALVLQAGVVYVENAALAPDRSDMLAEVGLCEDVSAFSSFHINSKGFARGTLPLKHEQQKKSQEAPKKEIDVRGAVKQPEDPYLRLVNWNNPYEETEAVYTLVRLKSVIDKGLVTMKGYHEMEEQAGKAANEMFLAAQEQGIEKYVLDNVYRSTRTQQGMWNKRVKKDPAYGQDPYNNPVKVMPGGVSEHATGLALDIFSKSYRRSNEGFAQTQAGQWLKENAHLYGFILRYPKDKQHITGVIFEPWHYRYVGVEAAADMFEHNLCLEEYVFGLGR
ncbi:M15 family metallopeptidase [Christensenellaceae bacterium OttesenSCG-928-M15]|nr:M15 family metallopeptidase [Christensenellaceae bacterium OttesenSCG-928-M15]